MRFNKHQRDIIKAINNKEVYDIESFVKKFKLYEHFIVDKEKIKKAFDESESGKVYPVDVVKNLLEHENKRRITMARHYLLRKKLHLIIAVMNMIYGMKKAFILQ